MKAKTAVFLLAFGIGMVLQVSSIPAKHKFTTPPPEKSDYEEEEEEEQEEEQHGADQEEMAKYMTPECMKTLQKHKNELDALKGNTDQAKAEALFNKLIKGGCKPLLDYAMKSHKKKQG